MNKHRCQCLIFIQEWFPNQLAIIVQNYTHNVTMDMIFNWWSNLLKNQIREKNRFQCIILYNFDDFSIDVETKYFHVKIKSKCLNMLDFIDHICSISFDDLKFIIKFNNICKIFPPLDLESNNGTNHVVQLKNAINRFGQRINAEIELYCDHNNSEVKNQKLLIYEAFFFE